MVLHRIGGIAVVAAALLVIMDLVPARALAESHGTVFYSGEYARISAKIPAHGLELEGDRVTTAASRFGLNLVWGRRWYQRFAIDLYSNSGLIPTRPGTGDDHRINLANLSMLLGLPFGHNVALRLEHVEYLIAASQTGDGVDFYNYEERRRYNRDADIELGYRLDMILLEFSVRDDEGDARAIDEFSGGSWITGGYGATYVCHTGVWDRFARNQSYIAEKVGWSVTARLRWRYGAKNIGRGASLYAGGMGTVMAGTAMIMQAGYEAGVLVATSDGFRLRGFLGGYFWWVSGDEPTSFESDLGWQAGVRFIKSW